VGSLTRKRHHRTTRAISGTHVAKIKWRTNDKCVCVYCVLRLITLSVPPKVHPTGAKAKPKRPHDNHLLRPPRRRRRRRQATAHPKRKHICTNAEDANLGIDQSRWNKNNCFGLFWQTSVQHATQTSLTIPFPSLSLSLFVFIVVG
jgi:hypothetical protein